MDSSEDISILEDLIGQCTEIIDKLYALKVTWNENQCKHILGRFNAIGKKLDIMGSNSTSDGSKVPDGGLIYDKLVQILKKGKKLVEQYVAPEINSLVVAQLENRGAFQELDKELDTLVAELGLQDLRENVKLTRGTNLCLQNEDDLDKKRKMLQYYADLDKKHMQTTGEKQSGKLAQVLSEKATTNMDVKKSGASKTALPSYLRIDGKSDIKIDEKQRVREYKRKSNRDPKEQDGWASVKSGTWLGCDFAIKKFKCGSDAIQAQWNESQLQWEVEKLVELQHPHVVRLVGFGKSEEECIFVMELMRQDLRRLIGTRLDSSESKHDKRPFTESEELDIINQIAKGMYFMHTKGYAHGDLKCSNILVNEFGDHLEVKLSDFRGSQSLDKAWDFEAFEQASKTRRPRWTAPEAIDHYGWDPQMADRSKWVQPSKDLLKQSDTYSFGMTCFEILTGKYPFDGIREENGGPLLERIKEGAAEKWNQFPPELNEDLKGLITSCWNKDPSQRPDFGKICHLLDTISFKRPVDGTSTVSAVLKQMSPALESKDGDKFPKVELLRSLSLVKEDIPGHLMIREPEELQRIEPEIAEGAFGKVFKATWLGCTFAMKSLMSSKSNTRDLQREVSYLIQVSRHPCIVQMVGLSENKDGEHSIVMEYMDSNLREVIELRIKSKNTKPFTFAEAAVIITKIAWGMAYLHSRGLVHLDLNPSNVLAKDYAKTVDVKIMDFGTSCLEDPTKAAERDFYKGIGSGFYRAPEMLPLVAGEILPPELPARKSKADLKALKTIDVYSFGMICHEVLAGDAPWSRLQLTDYAGARKGQYQPEWPSDCPPELILLIQRCWSMASQKRPTFIEICENLRDIFGNNL